MENRHGLVVDACLTLADGHAGRTAAPHRLGLNSTNKAPGGRP